MFRNTSQLQRACTPPMSRSFLEFGPDKTPKFILNHVLSPLCRTGQSVGESHAFLRYMFEIYLTNLGRWLTFDGESPYFGLVQYDIVLISWLQAQTAILKFSSLSMGFTFGFRVSSIIINYISPAQNPSSHPVPSPQKCPRRQPAGPHLPTDRSPYHQLQSNPCS